MTHRITITRPAPYNLLDAFIEADLLRADLAQWFAASEITHVHYHVCIRNFHPTIKAEFHNLHDAEAFRAAFQSA